MMMDKNIPRQLDGLLIVVSVLILTIIACNGEEASSVKPPDANATAEAQSTTQAPTNTSEPTFTTEPTRTQTIGEQFRDRVFAITDRYNYRFDVIVHLMNELNNNGSLIYDEGWRFSLEVELEELLNKNNELRSVSVPPEYKGFSDKLSSIANHYDEFVELLSAGINEHNNNKIARAVEEAEKGHRELEEIVSELDAIGRESTETLIPVKTIPASEVIVNVFNILGKSTAEVENILGEPQDVIQNDDKDDKLGGGEDRFYGIKDCVVFVSFDQNGISRLFQVWSGLSPKGYSFEDWPEVLPRFGVYVGEEPDSKSKLIWEWEDWKGYKIRIAASGGVVHSVQIANRDYAP